MPQAVVIQLLEAVHCLTKFGLRVQTQDEHALDSNDWQEVARAADL